MDTTMIKGQAGGLATLQKYGREHYATLGHEYGRKGGRPKFETTLPKQPIKINLEKELPGKATFTELLAAWKLRQGSLHFSSLEKGAG